MSFTTRCPSCGTVFRVVADQLKISDGWVRCGHCGDVFDATIDLDAWLPPGPGAAPPPPVAGSLPAAGWQQHLQGHGHAAPPPARADAPGGAEAAQPDGGDLPSDEDLRAWFGEGPLDPPAAWRSDAPPTDAQDAAEEGFEPLEPWEPLESLDTLEPSEPAEPLAPLMPSLAEAPAAAPGPPPEPEPAADPPLVLPEPEAPQPSSDPLDVPSVSSMLTTASHDEPSEAAEDESDFHAELERFAHSTRTPLARADAEAEAAPSRAADAEAGRQDEPADEPMPPGPGGDPNAAVPQPAPEEAEAAAVPGFVRQAQRQAFWSSRGVRVALSVFALLLGLLLLGQWAYHGRHQLVAAQPSLKPWVQRACGWLGCDLAPVHRLEAIEIESADLVRRLGNFHSFDIVLRNQSGLEVALPALELSLTDGGGAVVSRRVFLPQDWPEAPAFLPPKDRVALSLRLSIALADGVPTAGYRALVFYP